MSDETCVSTRKRVFNHSWPDLHFSIYFASTSRRQPLVSSPSQLQGSRLPRLNVTGLNHKELCAIVILKLMQHFCPRTIPYGRGTRAYWAREANGTLILFVHGFNGKPVSTWNDFPTLLQQYPEGSGCDLLFYGYDSLYKRARFSAAELFKSLDAFVTRPANIVNRSLSFDARSGEFEYTKVVLIAHSLGAIVARRALLEAVSKHKSWTNKIALVLFAPAHLGADVLTLMAQTHCLSGLAGFLLRYKFQTLLDLEPKCQTLTQLATETLTALSVGVNGFLTARVVCFGDDDTVVDPNRFANDPDPEIELGKGHCDICKPSFTFKKPLDLICHYL